MLIFLTAEARRRVDPQIAQIFADAISNLRPSA
jgi:hypothetical protein